MGGGGHQKDGACYGGRPCTGVGGSEERGRFETSGVESVWQWFGFNDAMSLSLERAFEISSVHHTLLHREMDEEMLLSLRCGDFGEIYSQFRVVKFA